jgi:hypothetical protein
MGIFVLLVLETALYSGLGFFGRFPAATLTLVFVAIVLIKGRAAWALSVTAAVLLDFVSAAPDGSFLLAIIVSSYLIKKALDKFANKEFNLWIGLPLSVFYSALTYVAAGLAAIALNAIPFGTVRAGIAMSWLVLLWSGFLALIFYFPVYFYCLALRRIEVYFKL